MYLICFEPSYMHVYMHSCAYITRHVQFQLSCRAERRIDQGCKGNCSLLQPKMFQGLPHWNKLVQWQSALSLQHHTSTIEWKYELLFVVTFVKLHLTALNHVLVPMLLSHVVKQLVHLLAVHISCYGCTWEVWEHSSS